MLWQDVAASGMTLCVPKAVIAQLASTLLVSLTLSYAGATWSQASALAKVDHCMLNRVASAKSGVCESEVTANDVFG